MIREMTAEELDRDCRTYVALKAKDMSCANLILLSKYGRVDEDEACGFSNFSFFIRLYKK